MPVEAQLAALTTQRIMVYSHYPELFNIAALNFDVGVTSVRRAITITIHGQNPMLLYFIYVDTRVYLGDPQFLLPKEWTFRYDTRIALVVKLNYIIDPV